MASPQSGAEVTAKDFQHDSTRLYSNACPALPPNAPVGCPHVIDLHALEALLATNSTVPLKAQDTIATILYHHSESALKAFLDIKTYDHFEFICVAGKPEVPSIVIKRERNVVICGEATLPSAIPIRLPSTPPSSGAASPTIHWTQRIAYEIPSETTATDKWILRSYEKDAVCEERDIVVHGANQKVHVLIDRCPEKESEGFQRDLCVRWLGGMVWRMDGHRGQKVRVGYS